MAPIKHRRLPRPSVSHGMNDSNFPSQVALSQVSLSKNWNMTHDGRLRSRGGSERTSASAAAASAGGNGIYEFQSVSSGTVTRKHMIFFNTVLYEYDPSAKTYSSKQTGLANVLPSVAMFRDNAGVDSMYWADGIGIYFYDGTAVTNITANFQAGAAGSKVPRYLLALHERLWAAGGTCDARFIYYSPQIHAEQNWGSQDYVKIAGGRVRCTGLGRIYDYPLIGTEDAIQLILGKAGDVVDPYRVVEVSSEEGISSHWSIVTVEGKVYWRNQSGFYVGRLRAAEKDGLDVERISGNMHNTIQDSADGDWDNCQGVYLGATRQQIYWTQKTTDATNNDRLFVYSVARSRPEDIPPPFGADLRFVWAGYHTGLDYNSIGVVKDSNGVPTLYVSGSDGFTRKYHSDYLEDRLSDGTGGSNLSIQLDTREETFGGPAGAARVYAVWPTFHQRVNGSLRFEYVINQSRRLPSSPKTITHTGNVPYLHSDDTTVLSTIGSTIFTERPVLTAKIRVGKKCTSFLGIFTNLGSDSGEEFEFVGETLEVQRRHTVDARDA